MAEAAINMGQKRAAQRRQAPAPELDSRGRLIEAAGIAFMERGYSGTTIDDVAAVLGVTKGAVYHHFSGKADIYFAVQEHAMARIDSSVRPEIQRNLPPDEMLRRMAHAHLMAIFTDFPGAKVAVEGLERSVMNAAGIEERRRMRRMIVLRKNYERMFRDVITQGIDQGLFVDEPPELLTKGVLGALNWATVWFDPARTKSRGALDSLSRKLADYAVRGALLQAMHTLPQPGIDH